MNLEDKTMLDVVNKDDVVIDSQTRIFVHKNSLRHREVHVWLFDKDKNIYFQKSAKGKSSAGLFDASIGGHIDKGENYLEAAVREGKEESGIIMNQEDLAFLIKFQGISRYKNLTIVNNFIRSIFIYKHPVSSQQLKYDENETDGFYKFSLDFLSNMKDKEKSLFHKFVPTHELPYIISYLNKL